MKLFHRIIYLCVAIAAICFAVLNRQRVEIDLFVFTVELSLFIPVLGALAVGWLWGTLVEGVIAGRWRWRARRGDRRAASLESELSSLRDAADRERRGAEIVPPRRRLADRARALLNDS